MAYGVKFPSEEQSNAAADFLRRRSLTNHENLNLGDALEADVEKLSYFLAEREDRAATTAVNALADAKGWNAQLRQERDELSHVLHGVHYSMHADHEADMAAAKEAVKALEEVQRLKKMEKFLRDTISDCDNGFCIGCRSCGTARNALAAMDKE